MGYEISGRTGCIRSKHGKFTTMGLCLNRSQNLTPCTNHERLFGEDARCKNNVLAARNTITGRRLKCDKRGSYTEIGGLNVA